MLPKSAAGSLEFAGRVYSSDGRYYGRLVSVTKYVGRLALCIIRTMGGDDEIWVDIADIVIEPN
jgi:hypothetical protein